MSFNPSQPIRPRYHPEDGTVMNYATFPPVNRLNRAFKVCSSASMITQCRLYRAAYKGEFERQMATSDIHQWCFHDTNITKAQMGYVLVRSVIYEPRLMMNNKMVGKATMTYVFRTDKDLLYGLEWMICTWLRRFLNIGATQDQLIGPNAEEIAKELDLLGNSDDENYLEVYESKFYDSRYFIPEPNWLELCAGLKENIPERPAELRAPRTAIRDLSVKT